MLEPWNDNSVLPPPINTSKCTVEFSINDLRGVCTTIIRVLSKQLPLHKESAIFSRFVYKFDKKFRNDIGYRNFKKVNTALRKYLSLTLSKDIQNFMDLLPFNNETEQYLPTRQMLQFVLVKLMTFSKLMYRTTVCSKQAAIFYLDRIKRGESHWMCLMPYALLSRVWSLVLVLLQHSCYWYNQLYPFLKHLPFKGLDFLPNKYKLPINMEEWISMKHLSDTGRFEWSQKLAINIDSIIVEDQEDDLCENILKYVNNINKKKENSDEPEIQLTLPKHEVSTEHVSNKYDEGVAVSRQHFKQLIDVPPILMNPTVGKVGDKHLIDNVSDQDSLKEFIESEEIFRNEFNDMSLTRHLSFMQWQALKTAFMKLESCLINRRNIGIKVKKIWQRKCLEYL